MFQGLGDKNSSRVLAAPGGKSSICFGASDDTPPAPARKSTEPSPAEAAQSSPAGQGRPADQTHSSIFGGEAGDAGTPDNQKVKRVSKGTGQYNPMTGDGQSSGYNPVTGEDYDKHDFDKVSPRQKYANDQTRGAYNPITGELYEDSPQNADSGTPSKGDQGRGDFNPITGEAYVPKKEVHTSTRVRQPPGGASSGLW